MMKCLLHSLPNGVQGELLTSKSSSLSVAYADSQFEDIKNSQARNTTLRLIKNGKMAVSSSSKPNDEQTLLKNAMDMVEFGTEVKHDFPEQANYLELELVDEAVTQVELSTMVDVAEDLVGALRDYDSRIQIVADVTRSEESVSLENTAGFSGTYRKTGWSYYLGGQLVQGDDMLWLGQWVAGANLRDDYAALKADVIHRFDRSKTVVPFEAGTYPVIFAPEQVAFLLEPFLASLNGKAIMRDISPWKGKRGAFVLDERLSIIDDGTLPFCASSVPFDREGTPTRRTVLIEQGVIKQEILDIQSGEALSLPSTGNGTLTGPRTHHVILSPGSDSVMTTRKSIDRGLIVLDSMGAWAGNPYSGNVSGTISLGLLIESGEVVGRVKDCMFSINSFRHFKDHLIATSSETREDGSSTYPYVTLDEVVISTR